MTAVDLPLVSGAAKKQCLTVGGISYATFSLTAAAADLPGLATLPHSLRVLAENLLRHADDTTPACLRALAGRDHDAEIPFRPARVLLQDLLGVPALADLAALRDAVAMAGGDPATVNPRIPVDLVIDHSLCVDVAGSPDAMARNVALEFERNAERFAFLHWCHHAFANLRVVPPGKGILHQINLEFLAEGVRVDTGGTAGQLPVAFPDTLVGTDSHTTMVNGLGVLGWGVGGIEAEAAMLGSPLVLALPPVLGIRLTGRARPGVTATDVALTITERLRRHGVVGRFVEFHGPGLDGLPVADRATVANMAPEYGATCVYFPIDRAVVDYLAFTGRDAHRVALVEAYARAQGLWRDAGSPTPVFDEDLELDLSEIGTSLAGPLRPEQRLPLSGVAASFARDRASLHRGGAAGERQAAVADGGRILGGRTLGDGDVVLAALTSCTNTSNPALMIAAGLLARNAVARGLATRPWVKTSLAPGSRVVGDYLARAGLQEPLDALGFQLVGFGCTSCNGMSGPLSEAVSEAITQGGLTVAAVMSSNRNFEGRIHPLVRAAYLASPPLVVAYALAGSVTVDLSTEPLGTGRDGRPVFLGDLWPSPHEIEAAMAAAVTPELFRDRYASVFDGDDAWTRLDAGGGTTWAWNPDSTYLRRPPYLDGLPAGPAAPTDLVGLRPLVVLGDSVTTDHISPSGAILADSPAGRFLIGHGVGPADFNSYGTRRGNHLVGMRATFANPRLRNELVPGVEGGLTRLDPDGPVMTVFDAAAAWRERGQGMIVVAGHDYGCGSSRDWAAKGLSLLGVKAVVAESFERIHRSNLLGMGVLPLEFAEGASRRDLRLRGGEAIDIAGLSAGIAPHQPATLSVRAAGGGTVTVPVICRLDTQDDINCYRHGGLLPRVFRDHRATIQGEGR